MELPTTSDRGTFLLFEHLEDANVGRASWATAAEHQGDLLHTKIIEIL
jgi:hypothetical protein